MTNPSTDPNRPDDQRDDDDQTDQPAPPAPAVEVGDAESVHIEVAGKDDDADDTGGADGDR